MASLEEIRKIRLQKLELLKKAGMNPYPISSDTEMTLGELSQSFVTLEKEKRMVIVGGRIMSSRAQGALAFADLNDGTAKFQTLFSKEKTNNFDLFIEASDIGDFIEVTGTLFTTNRGQNTIEVKSWKMLAKSLRPLPEKRQGLQDMEERFRRRYLDTLMSQESKDRFILRSNLIKEIRKIFDEVGFLEVETPILQPIAGGASAEPFVTHHKALDTDLYLRIAPELYLKELVAGGFPKVYEIGRLFRNEGIDVTHNPEFTTVEWYNAYSNASKEKIFVEQTFKRLVQTLKNSLQIEFDGQVIDFSKPFNVISYIELLKETGINNIETLTKNDLKEEAHKFSISVEKGDTRPKILDKIYKKVCRPKLIQPTFIIDYPVDFLPLAKRTEKNQKIADAFQLVIGGYEVVKAFSELNDPIDQRERFLEQEKNKKAGDTEAQPLDTEFLEAMEYGMPPMGGAAISIDRTTMLLSNVKNIREVILFPTLRPRE